MSEDIESAASNKASFPDYLQSRMADISLQLITSPTNAKSPYCFYSGQFHGQRWSDDTRKILDEGNQVIKLPKLKNSDDFPNHFALYIREALQKVVDSNGSIILSLEPEKIEGETKQDFERRKLLLEYTFFSTFVARQVNEPKGIKDISVSVVLPADRSLEGYLTEGHTVFDVWKQQMFPPHIHSLLTDVEKAFREGGFIRQSFDTVYNAVTGVDQALALQKSRKNGATDPRLPESLAALHANNTISIQK